MANLTVNKAPAKPVYSATRWDPMNVFRDAAANVCLNLPTESREHFLTAGFGQVIREEPPVADDQPHGQFFTSAWHASPPPACRRRLLFALRVERNGRNR